MVENMPTNLAIEDTLLKKALKAGGFRTKKETVTKALEEFIQRRQQCKILRAMGSIEFREGWNYKADRQDRESRR
jgi:Arc/MetJ family transcription regulator